MPAESRPGLQTVEGATVPGASRGQARQSQPAVVRKDSGQSQQQPLHPGKASVDRVKHSQCRADLASADIGQSKERQASQASADSGQHVQRKSSKDSADPTQPQQDQASQFSAETHPREQVLSPARRWLETRPSNEHLQHSSRLDAILQVQRSLPNLPKGQAPWSDRPASALKDAARPSSLRAMAVQGDHPGQGAAQAGLGPEPRCDPAPAASGSPRKNASCGMPGPNAPDGPAWDAAYRDVTLQRLKRPIKEEPLDRRAKHARLHTPKPSLAGASESSNGAQGSHRPSMALSEGSRHTAKGSSCTGGQEHTSPQKAHHRPAAEVDCIDLTDD